MDKDIDFEEFIKKHANKYDACYNYKEYPTEIQESLENVYKACWRFNLRNAQTIYMLNEVLKPYDSDLMGIMK